MFAVYNKNNQIIADFEEWEDAYNILPNEGSIVYRGYTHDGYPTHEIWELGPDGNLDYRKYVDRIG